MIRGTEQLHDDVISSDAMLDDESFHAALSRRLTGAGPRCPTPDGQRTRILIEATNSLTTTLNTGIQRVVRSVIREAAKLDWPVECVPVVFRDGEFYDARAWLSRCEGRLRRHATALRITRAAASLSSKVHPSLGSLPQRGMVRLRKIFYPATLMRQWDAYYWRTYGERIRFSPRDILITLDASWMYDIWPALVEAQRQGCKIGAIIYDLIPIRYPEFCGGAHLHKFQDWLDAATDHADFLLAISESTRDDVEDYVRSSDRGTRRRSDCFGSFRLGADFSPHSANGHCRRDVAMAFCGDVSARPYLVVGTIEPRKNHSYLLDAFDLVWRRHPRVRLCLAGAIGWNCEKTLERIRNHPRFGRSLLMFNDLSDAELQYCYRHAKALVFPSIIEGFGLPIVEALHLGLPVLAGDTPIHREVGHDFCRYFDLSAASSLAALVEAAEHRGDLPPKKAPSPFRPATWAESCRDLVERTLELAAAADSARDREPVAQLVGGIA